MNDSSGIDTLSKNQYRGRFAPSPTGPLHFGSLIAAIASYLEAKTHHGKWFLRIDDSDYLREQKNAADTIKRTIELHGFEWDEDVQYQSNSGTQYDKIKNYLIENKKVFRCNCSRKILKGNKTGLNGVIYTGTCRNKYIINDYSIRIFANQLRIKFIDEIQGLQSSQLDADIGDFIIWRRDNIISYHLATIIDDNELGITHIVRGNDLLYSTFCQLYLQDILNYKNPVYSHIPVVVGKNKQKLSKQFGAKEISNEFNSRNLVDGLLALKQKPPDDLASSSLKDIWAWAIENWSDKNLKMTKSVEKPNSEY